MKLTVLESICTHMVYQSEAYTRSFVYKMEFHKIFDARTGTGAYIHHPTKKTQQKIELWISAIVIHCSLEVVNLSFGQPFCNHITHTHTHQAIIKYFQARNHGETERKSEKTGGEYVIWWCQRFELLYYKISHFRSQKFSTHFCRVLSGFSIALTHCIFPAVRRRRCRRRYCRLQLYCSNWLNWLTQLDRVLKCTQNCRFCTLLKSFFNVDSWQKHNLLVCCCVSKMIEIESER